MRILLLNPPGSRRYLRDYYCSHVSKGRYVWQPIDLLILSGHLAENHDVIVIDAIAENLSVQKTYRAITLWQPEVIIFLTGSVSWLEDLAFFHQLPEAAARKLFAIGDLPLFEPQLLFEQCLILDGILFDFISAAVLHMVQGDKEQEGKGYIYRDYPPDREYIRFPSPSDYTVPLPQYGLFRIQNYHLVHVHHHPFMSVLTDFGCPFRCSFCPYENIPFLIRNYDNLFSEFQQIQSRGIKEIWFKDQSFGAQRSFTLKVLQGLIEHKFNFSWSCETRVEFLDRHMMSLMKQAGCHTVMIGVETADQQIRARYQKPVPDQLYQDVITRAHQAGLKTLVHFIIGLPGETRESLQKLPDFALGLKSDFATFNIATPQYGTTLRKEAIRHHWFDDSVRNIDSSCSFPLLSLPEIDPSFVWNIRNKALRHFYFRPVYILRHIFRTRTVYQWRNLIREAFSLLRDLLQA
ncbi:B12-binding domain-containing radical SAM protein [candidate division CSSED10-310 bacterium]|uniref:B12-binding domain-containing radical SAM protein n=1 Tax=candidate division CSSED10-310 bacterium TaxID=2855610 RepID=A0ABV6YXB1_UNCC1